MNRIITKPALIVIDMQKYFIDPDGDAYLPMSKDIIKPITILIDHFKKTRHPIIFTRHGHKKTSPPSSMHRFWNGDLLYEDDPQAEIIELCHREQATNLIILPKEHYSAFEETNLDVILKANDIHDIVLCGVMTNLCVETTARCGFMKGYNPIVVADATATKNKEMHFASLNNISYGFGYVMDTEKIICMTS